ncbi:MAG: DUF885 family protein, partial [Bacteroidota bacterium]|nr:DUF885 family protein [Bacteroidota bacterium]
MNRTILLLCSFVFFTSCGGDPGNQADREFEVLADRFIGRYLQLHPEAATALGTHRYDHRLDDYSATGIASSSAMLRAYRDTLRSIRVEELSPGHMIDYDIFQQVLDARLFELEELREWEWNP